MAFIVEYFEVLYNTFGKKGYRNANMKGGIVVNKKKQKIGPTKKLSLLKFAYVCEIE